MDEIESRLVKLYIHEVIRYDAMIPNNTRNLSLGLSTLMLLMSILILACTNEEDAPIEPVDMWSCYNERTWDAVKVNDALIGQWEWEYISCYWDSGEGNSDEYRGMVIEFRSDNTLSVMTDGQVTQTSDWEVVDGDVDLYAIDVVPDVLQLYGRIFLCEDLVEFDEGYVDGCNNYFRRKK